jgi:hypothetical protein
MGYATNSWPGDGTTTQYEFNFVGGYLDQSHVKAYYLTDATFTRTEIDMSLVVWVGPNTLLFPTATPVGSSITIYRQTPRNPLIDFEDTSRITQANLNRAYLQALFISVEAADLLDSTIIQEVLNEIETVHVEHDNVVTLASQVTADALAADAARVAAEAAQAISESSAASAMVSATSANSDRVAAQAAAASAAVNAAAALISQTNALASQTAAAASAGAAGASASIASASAASATADAVDAGTAAAIAQAIADALEGGTVGFTAAAYDLGSVADPSTYFNRDLGTL